jgi:hypothetical protein
LEQVEPAQAFKFTGKYISYFKFSWTPSRTGMSRAREKLENKLFPLELSCLKIVEPSGLIEAAQVLQ